MRLAFLRIYADCGLHFPESEPECRTNISLPGNAIDTSDHIEIVCSVTFKGMWTPVFVCASDSPGTAITERSSNRVQHSRVIAASDIDDFGALNCSMTFSLADDYRAMFPDARSEPENPMFDFVWNTSVIRIVNASGKYCYRISKCVLYNFSVPLIVTLFSSSFFYAWLKLHYLHCIH